MQNHPPHDNPSINEIARLHELLEERGLGRDDDGAATNATRAEVAALVKTLHSIPAAPATQTQRMELARYADILSDLSQSSDLNREKAERTLWHLRGEASLPQEPIVHVVEDEDDHPPVALSAFIDHDRVEQP